METISQRQCLFFVIILGLDGMLRGLPNQVITLARMDAWLSYVFGMIGVLGALWVITKVLARFPGQDLFEILVTRYPVAGRIVSTLLLLYVFIMFIRDLHLMEAFVVIALLPTTPIAVISLMVVLCVVVAARSGLEVIARLCELWLPLLLIVIVLLPFLLFPEFELQNLTPAFDRGILPPLAGSWYVLAYMGQLLILPFVFSSTTLNFRLGFKGLAIVTFLSIWISIIILMSLGDAIASNLIFPFYETIRLIQVTDFLDRFDVPFYLIYIPFVLAKISLYFYIILHGIKKIIPALQVKQLAASLGIWAFVCAAWFFNNTNGLYNFMRPWSLLAIIMQTALPFLLLIAVFPKKSKPRPSNS